MNQMTKIAQTNFKLIFVVQRSHEAYHPFILDLSIMLNIFVPSVEAATCHRAYIIRMSMALYHFVHHIVCVVRSEPPLQKTGNR